MSEKKQTRMYPYIVDGTNDLRLAEQAISAAFDGGSFDASTNKKVVVGGQTLFVSIDHFLRGEKMTLRVEKSNGDLVEIPRYQFG